MWRFEKNVPMVAETHLRIRREEVRNPVGETRHLVDENVSKGMKTIKEWVRKG